MSSKKQNIHSIRQRKSGEKIVVLTAYTEPFARLLDPHVDILLVGDSLGMTLYGMKTTLPVSTEMMIAHGKAVAGASEHALVVIDLAFGSYQESPEQAFRTSARVLAETGAAAVKFEGGVEMTPTIRFLTQRGIAVMAHIGLKPQHVGAMGGYRTQGKSASERDALIADAKAVEEAGAFSVVLEGIQEEVARDITAAISIPTIGIGASPACDGQVLVTEDILGLTSRAPSFVKQYADLGKALGEAAGKYAQDVRNGSFPAAEHCFSNKK